MINNYKFKFKYLDLKQNFNKKLNYKIFLKRPN